jgi:hypothetical protein
MRCETCHRVVRRDPDEILVECAVVDRAEGEAVRHERLALLLGVGSDVGGIEQPRLL